MAGIGAAEAKSRLLADRAPRDARTNNAPANGSLVRGFVTGQKLVEASGYLKSARAALINWTKEVYANADALDMQLPHVQEILGEAERLENLRARLEVKGSIFGA